MPLKRRKPNVSFAINRTSERANHVLLLERAFIMPSAKKIFVVIFIVLIGLTWSLQRATAESQPHRVYLAMISAGIRATEPQTTTSPATTIRVVAQAGQSCTADEWMPVYGARILLRGGRISQMATTDPMGQALFSATTEPAILQIEWPAGMLPCPNSQPIVELPAGAGEVTFLARYLP